MLLDCPETHGRRFIPIRVLHTVEKKDDSFILGCVVCVFVRISVYVVKQKEQQLMAGKLVMIVGCINQPRVRSGKLQRMMKFIPIRVLHAVEKKG